MAETLAEAGSPDEALQVTRRHITDPQYVVLALCDIGTSRLKAGLMGQGQVMFDEATRTANQQPPYLQSQLLAQIQMKQQAVRQKNQASDTYLFEASPKDAQISAKPGKTIGWGYSITNQSNRYWLVPTALNPDSRSQQGLSNRFCQLRTLYA